MGFITSEAHLDLFGLLLFRMIASTLIYLPILLPFRGIGILHPLVFPFLLNLGKSLFKSQGNLIGPLINPSFGLQTTAAFTLNEPDLLSANYLVALSKILGLSMLYLGYFSFSKNIKPVKLPTGIFTSISSNVFLPVASIVGVMALLVFLQMQGGITAYFSSWGTSRSEATQGLGPILAVLKFIYIIPLTWYVLEGNKVFRNPIYLSVLFFALFSGYLTSGSRGSILNAAIPFAAVWIYQNRRIPVLSFASLGVAFFLLFGVLGKLRTSTFDKEVDWDILTDITLGKATEYSVDESSLWTGLGAAVAIFNKVPNEVDYLYGKPYLAALFFWLPRNIWENKPHGTGYYTGRLLFSRSEAGIPPGEFADAYFNFGWVGIIVVFFLKGLLIAWLSGLLVKAWIFNNKLLLIVFIILVDINFIPISLVSHLQQIGFFLIFITLFKHYPKNKISLRFTNWDAPKSRGKNELIQLSDE